MTTSDFHLRFDTDPKHLEPIRLRCEAFARDRGFDDRAVGEIGLCVNEAVANVIEHAYGFAGGKPIELWCTAPGDDTVRIRVRDWGNGVDPSKLPVKPKDPLVPKGLGLICLREMMDRIEYAPQPDGGILLTMERSRVRQKQPSSSTSVTASCGGEAERAGET